MQYIFRQMASIYSFLHRYVCVKSASLTYSLLIDVLFVQELYPNLRMELDCDMLHSPETLADMRCFPKNSSHVSNLNFLDAMSFFEEFGPTSPPHTIATRLIGMMMNAVPVVDITDFVVLSNSISHSVGNKTINAIINSPIYGDLFDNLLSVRGKALVLSPINCWTLGFKDYLLSSNPTISKVLIFH